MPVNNKLVYFKPSPKKYKSPFRNQVINLGSRVSSKNKNNISNKKSDLNNKNEDFLKKKIKLNNSSKSKDILYTGKLTKVNNEYYSKKGNTRQITEKKVICHTSRKIRVL